MTFEFKLVRNSLQWQFWHSRAKVQLFGGGYANGKTTTSVMKAIALTQLYPGSNGLVARATYPKLNDTVRKVWFDCMPKSWRKSFAKDENTLTLTNGSVVNFRYIAQQGKSAESTTSNLLSATYDWILIDQVEDPEITAKDFDDLVGRLRGSTARVGTHPMLPDMPDTGPRWFMMTTNPTANWVYSKLVRPYHLFKQGHKSPELLVNPSTGEPIMELFEGSTYTNADNLPADYIELLEGTYTGEMRTRFLLGKWGAFQGLIYPDYDAAHHVVSAKDVADHHAHTARMSRRVEWIEGYDYGIAKPTCYLLAFVDTTSNIIVCDGFYIPELDIDVGAKLIKRIRRKWGVPETHDVIADPDIFKRKARTTKIQGLSVAGLLGDEGINCVPGANDPISGITKVRTYLKRVQYHPHPLTGQMTSAHLYFSDGLLAGAIEGGKEIKNSMQFINDEIVNYRWKRKPTGEFSDEPIDKDDHALDTIKYMLAKRPAASLVLSTDPLDPIMTQWREYEESKRDPRGGRRAA